MVLLLLVCHSQTFQSYLPISLVEVYPWVQFTAIFLGCSHDLLFAMQGILLIVHLQWHSILCLIHCSKPLVKLPIQVSRYCTFPDEFPWKWFDGWKGMKLLFLHSIFFFL